MVIGVPKETRRHEHRVGLTPYAVARLAGSGHTTVVEQGAGHAAKFSDQEYEAAGAHVVYSSEEAYKRADTVCRVGLMPGDAELMRPGSTVCAFQHLAVKPRDAVERLMELGVTVIGYEIIRGERGGFPVLDPFSEMAGQMAVNIAAHYLQNEAGGRGILLGNVTGVAPPTVLILGAGTVARSAARQALASGAHVIILGKELDRLRWLNQLFGGQVVTLVASAERIARYSAIADVVIGAVLVPGAPAPVLVTEGMVRAMKPGSVILDISIDQGGCVETSRPTTLDDPTFIAHDVVHYCVPTMTANVGRTASRALTDAVLPLLRDLTDKGLDAALLADPGLAAGVYLYRGRMVNEKAAAALGIPAAPLHEMIGGDDSP